MKNKDYSKAVLESLAGRTVPKEQNHKVENDSNEEQEKTEAAASPSVKRRGRPKKEPDNKNVQENESYNSPSKTEKRGRKCIPKNQKKIQITITLSSEMKQHIDEFNSKNKSQSANSKIGEFIEKNWRKILK